MPTDIFVVVLFVDDNQTTKIDIFQNSIGNFSVGIEMKIVQQRVIRMMGDLRPVLYLKLLAEISDVNYYCQRINNVNSYTAYY